MSRPTDTEIEPTASAHEDASPAPQVSVVVRSYNRVSMLCDLLERLRSQRHDSFEVVVVEQSTKVEPDAAGRLETLAADPRIRVLKNPPLGGPRARNVGVQASRGEIILLIDDDDVPEDDDWIAAHLANYDDPRCLGVTGRQKYSPDEDECPYSPLVERIAYYRCQKFSPVLKLPWVCVRLTRRKTPIQNIHGSNSSLRRSAFERFGGWDEDTDIEDEASFGYRVTRDHAPGEYFTFDPAPVAIRGRDAPGGMGKRFMAPGIYFGRFMRYVLNIIGRYHPWRVRLLYPLYIAAVTVWTISWIWDDSELHGSIGRRILASAWITISSPYHGARALIRRAREAPRSSDTGSRERKSDRRPRSTSA